MRTLRPFLAALCLFTLACDQAGDADRPADGADTGDGAASDGAPGGDGEGRDGEPSADGEPDGDGDVEADGDDADTPKEPIGAAVPDDFYLKLEAEDATLGGGSRVEQADGASQGSVVEVQGDGTIDFHLRTEVASAYELVVTAGVPSGRGTKFNGVFTNGERQGQLKTDEAANFYASPGLWIALEAGDNTISLRAEWGYTRFDFLELKPIRSPYLSVSRTPKDPQATQRARRLLNFLVDEYGRHVISGQQERTSADQVFAMTGREPALLGVDLMDYSPSRVERAGLPERGAIEDALEADRSGAIVTVAWHWNAPSGLVDRIYTDDQGQEVDASWYKGFYSYATTFDLRGAMADTSSESYRLLVRDIDAIAEQLRRLSDGDVPVLFRPLHEASGGWFWWGADGPEPYLDLWQLVHERLVDHHGLHNLIWVWNGQSTDWYPGDQTVDIVAEDIYDGARNYAPQLARFGQATQYADAPALVALSETGALPDPDRLQKAGPTWSYFCTWSGAEYVEGGTYNERTMFEKVYASDLVLTLDELPDLTTYRLP